jgi:hypothetical protein
VTQNPPPEWSDDPQNIPPNTPPSYPSGDPTGMPPNYPPNSYPSDTPGSAYPQNYPPAYGQENVGQQPAYGQQPGYGQQPDYGQPGYGQMPPGYSTAPAQAVTGQDRTKVYGIVGMIVGVICCPIVGIVLGVLSIRESKRFNGSPTLGYFAIALSVIGVIWSLTVGLKYR